MPAAQALASGVPEWSGEITYSNGSFGGAWTLAGQTVIIGAGNSITGNNIAALDVNGISYTYSGSISYIAGSFSGSITNYTSTGHSATLISGSGSSIIGTDGGALSGSITATPTSTDVASTIVSVLSSLIPSTTTGMTPATTVTFSGELGNVNDSLMAITGTNNYLFSGTDTGTVNVGSGWVGSGNITYSPSSGFSGTLGNVTGTLMVITGYGNTLTSQTDIGWIENGGSPLQGGASANWVNSGKITYDPTSNTFSGTLGNISYSMFAIGGSGNTLIAQTNTYPGNNASPTWVNSGTITATVS